MHDKIIQYRPTSEELVYTFGGNEPALVVQPGDTLSLFTEDAFGGKVRSVDDIATEKAPRPYVNPQTGPFYVEGAEPGDTLAIHLIDIQPARDWGVSTISANFGSLVGTPQTANLQPTLPYRTWIYQVDREQQAVIYQARDSDFTTRLPLDLFLGTIGVAPPPFEVRSALVPDAFGGNMDSSEVRAGVTIYLGVNVPGALFSIGDGHYAMGDGEACGVAVEGATNTLLTIDLLKGVVCPWPRFETDTEIMVAGSTRPLEDAFRIAHTQLIHWVEETGLSTLDTYQLISQTVRSTIANVVDPNYTVVAKVAKRFLPQHPWMNETHAKLRDLGQQLLSA
ncbi:MAG: acetamidase/formamidase family protein [Chloroflexota bacterium]